MKKILQGTIVSNKMLKTVVVKVETVKADKKYKKRYTAFKKFKADTNGNVFEIGDRVFIEECRPLSKDKCWRVIRKVEGKVNERLTSASPQDEAQV